MAASLPKVPRIALGSQGLEVSQLGLGCMGMSVAYGPPKPEEDLIALIRKSIDLGVTFLDTSDMYGPHTNEVLIGKALKGLDRSQFQLATKFAVRFEAGQLAVRGDPQYVRQCCEGSLQRLGLDYIDLYYQHRVDTSVPIEVTMGEMKKLVEEGKVKYLGLSEASADTIRRAHAVHPITAVQLEWSLWTRDAEKEIVPLCRELGIGVVPYSPLGRGFFGGKGITEELKEGDGRLIMHERFKGDNFERNKVFYDRLCALAAPKGCTPAQLALAWVLGQGKDVAPIPGTTRLEKLEENIGSLGLTLGVEESEQIAKAVPQEEVAGERYPKALMKFTWANADTPPLESWKPTE